MNACSLNPFSLSLKYRKSHASVIMYIPLAELGKEHSPAPITNEIPVSQKDYVSLSHLCCIGIA